MMVNYLLTYINSKDKMLLVILMSSGRIDLFCDGCVRCDNLSVKMTTSAFASIAVEPLSILKPDDDIDDPRN